MSKRRREFELSEERICELLFGDNSDNEEDLHLDNEDVGFLEEDFQDAEINGFETANVIIEPASTSNVEDVEESDEKPVREEIPQFQWKKVRSENWNSFPGDGIPTATAYGQFGEILIEFEDEDSEIEIFEKVANFDEFLEKIVLPQTKLYSEQKGHVFDIGIDELKAFFGMNIVMGYHTLPSIRDYWSTEPDLHVPFIANIMTRKRFEEIRSMLHFNDNENMTTPGDLNHDRAFKIRPVIEHFNKAFMAAISPTKFQSIDEHMIKFKGHNIMKQYVKGKPVKWGFKMWCRCDAKTGYLFEFDLYSGKKTESSEHGLGEGVVLKLTEKLKGLGCQVFIDNFFNSPVLQTKLLENETFSAGTVRSNRKFLPKSSVPSDKAMKKGDVACFRSNDIWYVKWMDNRPVHMLSNYLHAYPLSDVKRRKKGSAEKETVSCPDVVVKYNASMGGVDIMDQKKVTYQFDHRSRSKYYLRPVFDLIDISVNNAFIIYDKVSSQEDKLDAKAFRRTVARQLIGRFCNRKRPLLSAPIMKKKTRLCHSFPAHTLEKTDVRQRCKLCSRNKIQNRTNNKCVECNIYLCFIKGRDCFKLYHDY